MIVVAYACNPSTQKPVRGVLVWLKGKPAYQV